MEQIQPHTSTKSYSGASFLLDLPRPLKDQIVNGMHVTSPTGKRAEGVSRNV